MTDVASVFLIGVSIAFAIGLLIGWQWGYASARSGGTERG